MQIILEDRKLLVLHQTMKKVCCNKASNIYLAVASTIQERHDCLRLKKYIRHVVTRQGEMASNLKIVGLG